MSTIIKVPAYVAEKLDRTRKKDFRIETIKGSGPGGQHRNKRETGIRMTHKDTGLSAKCTTYKSQERNRRGAFMSIVKQLIAHYRVVGMRDAFVDTPDNTIRTYNKKRNTVKDHRSGEIGDYKKVLDGDLDVFTRLRGRECACTHARAVLTSYPGQCTSCKGEVW